MQSNAERYGPTADCLYAAVNSGLGRHFDSLSLKEIQDYLFVSAAGAREGLHGSLTRTAILHVLRLL